LKPVCFDTKSVTDPAAPSGLIVEPQPANTIASEAIRTTNAVRIAAVFQTTQTISQISRGHYAADVTR
jgi:hypothetical protein